MANSTIFSFGILQFQIFPVSISSIEHTTQAEWARKEIAGAQTYREWVGEGDETITLRGVLFPLFFRQARAHLGPQQGIPGLEGDQSLEWLENARRLGVAQMLIRGDGAKLGWFIVENISRGHTHISRDGIGQQVAFDARFQRVPKPGREYYLADSLLWNTP